MPAEERASGTMVRYVYVHAPFCVRRCTYCDFAVQVRRSGDVEGWLSALRGEVRVVHAEGLFHLAERLDTLYVGGGTPSLLGPAAMRGLSDVLGPERLRGSDLEWTAEANPESLTAEVARAWRAAGVNRLSLGVQTFHDGTLRWMGRMHGSGGGETAVRTARAAGIENLSVDLIFGLPAHLDRSWRGDLERTLALEVPHVSLYGLTVEPATPLARAVREGREPPVDEERYRDEFLLAAEMLGDAGYEQYEVSNFARDGAVSRHNAAYWRTEAYLGLGNGAHSFCPPVRRWNLRDWEAYATLARAGRSPEEGRETLDEDARRMERVWLGLRTSAGLDIEGLGDAVVERASAWVHDGLAEFRGRRLRLTARGWLLLDEIAVEIERRSA